MGLPRELASMTTSITLMIAVLTRDRQRWMSLNYRCKAWWARVKTEPNITSVYKRPCIAPLQARDHVLFSATARLSIATMQSFMFPVGITMRQHRTADGKYITQWTIS